MDNRVFKNAAWIIGCKIAQSLISLIIGLLTARYLGPSNYGIISYVASIVAFAVPIMQLGLNATLVKKFTPGENIFNPNSPKVVISAAGYALYFSRATIPYLRNEEQGEWQNKHDYFKHIGLYAYRCEVLRQITKLPMGILEKAESLEQLRWLENGYKIGVGVTDIETIGIDTPEDLAKAEAFLASRTL